MRILVILIRIFLALIAPAVACYNLWGTWAMLLCVGLQCFWLTFTPDEWRST